MWFSFAHQLQNLIMDPVSCCSGIQFSSLVVCIYLFLVPWFSVLWPPFVLGRRRSEIFYYGFRHRFVSLRVEWEYISFTSILVYCAQGEHFLTEYYLLRDYTRMWTTHSCKQVDIFKEIVVLNLWHKSWSEIH